MCVGNFVSTQISSLLLLCLLINQSFIRISATNASYAYDTDNDTYWRSLSYFTPLRGSRYGTITRRKSMYFAVSFQSFGKTQWGEWENLIRSLLLNLNYVTYILDSNRVGEFGNGNDSGCNEHGRRFPGLFILPNRNSLQISLSDLTECWYVIEKNLNIDEDIIYNIIINYNQTHSTISLSTNNATNNELIESEHLISNTSRTNDDSLLNQTMDIIISDPLTDAANVQLFNILILSYDDTLILPPTLSPV